MDAKRTPLYQEHVARKARMIPFGGWEMPVQYTGILEEHKAVREAAGLFDLSHMGEFYVEGPGAYDYLNNLLSNKLAKLMAGRAQYNLLLNEAGGVVDDLLVYKMRDELYMVVVNAANIQKDWEWFQKYLPSAGVKLTNASDDTALIAIQGPKSVEILAKATSTNLGEMKFYSFQEGKVYGKPALISATGYTGEKGFELYISPEDAAEIWNSLLDAGAESGLVPVGLGARDTLRLELAYSLYGNELTDETTPWEAGLDWTVNMDKDFVGKQALVEQAKDGAKRRLVGFKLIGKGVPRHGYEILDQSSEVIGQVTSGSVSPTLGVPIGLGYVAISQAGLGQHIWVKVRDKMVEAEQVRPPFVLPYYKR